MERLTERDEFGNADIIGVESEDLQLNLDFNQMNKVTDALNKLAEYEDFEKIFKDKMSEIDCDFLSDKEEFGLWLDRNRWIAKKCAEYARAEEQGLLLRSHCKVGDIIYEIHPLTGKISQRKIKSIVVCNCPELTIMYKSGYDYSNVHEDFGKTVFLTQAEAEQKLKERQDAKYHK